MLTALKLYGHLFLLAEYWKYWKCDHAAGQCGQCADLQVG